MNPKIFEAIEPVAKECHFNAYARQRIHDVITPILAELECERDRLQRQLTAATPILPLPITPEKRRALLTQCVEDYQACDHADDAALAATGIDSDSPLLNPHWLAFQRYLDAVSELVGDTHRGDHTWLSWFIWDNDCGAKEYKAKAKNQPAPKPIKTIDDLAELIEAELPPTTAQSK